MKGLTVIVPLYNMNGNEDNKNLLTRAIESVDDSAIIVIGAKDDIDSVKNNFETKENITFLVNTTSDTSYTNQVNIAVENVKTEFFSVLEYDDIYTNIWFKNLELYIEDDVNDTMAFLPLTEVYDVEINSVVGYANEAVWASSFSDEIGCYDIQCLDDYFNFNISGAVFRTDDFINLGKLKASMKLTFWYEFLLRALYRGKRIFVIPKIGYIHMVGRQDSLSELYVNNMSEKETAWWVDLAKKEYFFPHDRNKTYTEE